MLYAQKTEKKRHNINKENIIFVSLNIELKPYEKVFFLFILNIAVYLCIKCRSVVLFLWLVLSLEFNMLLFVY